MERSVSSYRWGPAGAEYLFPSLGGQFKMATTPWTVYSNGFVVNGSFGMGTALMSSSEAGGLISGSGVFQENPRGSRVVGRLLARGSLTIS